VIKVFKKCKFRQSIRNIGFLAREWENLKAGGALKVSEW
jgi:hypothetical protein